ncbi:glycoside hydrolase family 88 protein [Pedobacter cryoconitis]|uniref:Uncharacterized protein n=1 Tax=Pedobacter cryoconitis TaxID=188932 RepID=A0A327S9D4_9SPHI|nr:hypothetical protein [Pedobacter cryoconitis]RAJ22377.1 hypothetical protein LY11_04842 [Pedobacter cryoconitis]
MNGLSPWALSASSELAETYMALYCNTAGSFEFKVYQTTDSIWVRAGLPNGGRAEFRTAFSPGGNLEIKKAIEDNNGILLELESETGKQQVKIIIDLQETIPVLHYTTILTPKKDLLIPFWPRDIVISSKNGNSENTAGKIHLSQEGTRTGLIYLTQTRPKSASVLYLQNLTALSDYCQQTQTSCADTVGGNWPEMGFALPACKDLPLKAGKEVVINDAFVAFDDQIPGDQFKTNHQFLNLMARIYLLLPKPETSYQNWPEILEKGLKDLIESPGCWSKVAGHNYFNAYVSDYTTPPEIMVQLAVLLPLVDYVEWSKTDLEVIQTIKKGLPEFFDPKLGVISRWLPAAEDKLEGEEEQKKPGVMDSWYLHHPMLNLSRLALKGDKTAEKLFLDSLDFTIKVAHHFNYHWPVFYKMDTLEVIKAETADGKGGEKDVAGLYAHVMLQAWELTNEKRYLKESEKAAQTLQEYGFDIFYQANNTAFASGALLRLYKITKNELYLELSYQCLAAIFRNTQIWNCDYGYGKNFPKFFSLFPLNDAPYTAVYEEQEVFCALHDFLKHAEGVEILPSLKLLIAEYIRYLVDRAVYYYPTMLPKDMLEEKPKVGELDPKLWIALEDLQDGWKKSGTVGQEVYGAGNAFGILPRHYLLVPGEHFMVYVDYPTSGFKAIREKNIHFTTLGDDRLSCRMMIVKTSTSKLPDFKVTIKGAKEPLKEIAAIKGNVEYQLFGNQQVSISWTHE